MSIRANDVQLAAWRTFLSAHATVIRLLEEEMREDQGMPLSWFDVLIQLDGAPDGRLRMQELAGSLVISRSGLTRLFDRMADAGLVAREACVEDRRGTYAMITPEGRAKLRRAGPGHFRGVNEHFLKHLTGDDARTVVGALAKVVEATRSDEHASAGLARRAC